MSELALVVDSNFISPWALHAFVALEEKQLPYELKTVQLGARATQAAGYDAATKRLPALIRGGQFWLGESLAISEYLAESFPFPKHPRLFPENLEERGRAREVMLWLRTDLQALREERPTTTLWLERAKAPLSVAAREAADKLIAIAEPLLAHGRPTLFASWCIADVDLALALQRLNLNGDGLPATLKAYAEANWQRLSLAKWHALRRKLKASERLPRPRRA